MLFEARGPREGLGGRQKVHGGGPTEQQGLVPAGHGATRAEEVPGGDRAPLGGLREVVKAYGCEAEKLEPSNKQIQDAIRMAPRL